MQGPTMRDLTPGMRKGFAEYASEISDESYITTDIMRRLIQQSDSTVAILDLLEADGGVVNLIQMCNQDKSWAQFCKSTPRIKGRLQEIHDDLNKEIAAFEEKFRDPDGVGVQELAQMDQALFGAKNVATILEELFELK